MLVDTDFCSFCTCQHSFLIALQSPSGFAAQILRFQREIPQFHRDRVDFVLAWTCRELSQGYLTSFPYTFIHVVLLTFLLHSTNSQISDGCKVRGQIGTAVIRDVRYQGLLRRGLYGLSNEVLQQMVHRLKSVTRGNSTRKLCPHAKFLVLGLLHNSNTWWFESCYIAG